VTQAVSRSNSVQDRGQKRPGGLIVQAEAHQRHRLDHAQTMPQAPTQQLAVARRQQKPRPGKGGGGADESLEVLIALPYGMAEKADCGGVSCDAAAVLDHRRGFLRDRVEEFLPALVAVEPEVQPVTGATSPVVAGRTT
jgi:hypothetical protein